MFFDTSFESILLVFYVILVDLCSFLLRVSVFSYIRMDCKSDNISTDVFHSGADLAHLFDLQSQ